MLALPYRCLGGAPLSPAAVDVVLQRPLDHDCQVARQVAAALELAQHGTAVGPDLGQDVLGEVLDLLAAEAVATAGGGSQLPDRLRLRQVEWRHGAFPG